jgi:hypothetical protein
MVKLKYRKYDLVSNLKIYNMLRVEFEEVFADIPIKNQISAKLRYIEKTSNFGKIPDMLWLSQVFVSTQKSIDVGVITDFVTAIIFVVREDICIFTIQANQLFDIERSGFLSALGSYKAIFLENSSMKSSGLSSALL